MRGVVALAYVTAVFLFTVVTSCIIGIRMRRKIRRDLGRKEKNGDLTSIATWIKVDEVESRTNPNHDWVPRPSDFGLKGGPIPEQEKPIDLFADPKDKPNR